MTTDRQVTTGLQASCKTYLPGRVASGCGRSNLPAKGLTCLVAVLPCYQDFYSTADALDVLDVHAKTPGLYQVPKLRNLNLNFLDILEGRRDDGRTE